MARSLKGASLASLLLAYGSTNVHAVRGFFRVANAVLVQEAADPIRAPGTRSGHSHTVTGGSGFGITVDYATLQASTCTTSPVAQDRSAYWTPMVYFHHKNGSFEALDAINQGQQIYYSYQADDEAFPPGLRMIAGNNFARTKETPLNARDGYVIYDCIGGKQFNYPGFPTEKCPDKVRANVYFPTCGWANKTLDSWDHQSHVAYRQPDGKCPSTHPIRYPELHYELYWSNTLDGLDWADAANPSQPFVLSNGDPTGYGFHGDFFNGWDDTLAKAMADCDGGGSSGEPSTCKHFKVQTGDQMTACRKKGLSPDLGNNENIYGVLPKLPGCNRITNTEAEARAAAAEKCSDTDAPPVAGGTSSKSSSSLGQATSTKPSSTASSGIVTSTRSSANATSSTRSSANATSSTRSSSSAAVSSSSTPSRTASNPSSPTSSTCNATKTVTSTVTVFRTRTPLHTRPRATHV